MKRNVLLIGIIFCAINAFAQQDTLLAYNRWQNFFKDYAKKKYVSLEKVADINSKLEYGKTYNCLVIFKDSTKASVEFKMEFKGIELLADAYKKLTGSGYKEGYYEIAKKDVKFFVFDDITFVHDYNRKASKPKAWPEDWAILLIDGPIRYVELVYISRSAGTANVLPDLQKYDENIGSDVKYVGGFNFKKWAIKTFADYPELLAKIEAGEKGYTKTDGLNIITEYNEWVRKNDPGKFKSSMLFGYLIKGPM